MVDVVVTVGILVILFFLAGVSLNLYSAHHRPWRIMCVNNLKEDALAVKIWEGDHNDKLPQMLSVTNGGSRELLLRGNVAAYFQIMSYELSTPKILFCDIDPDHIRADSFTNLNNKNISYFVNSDATEAYPQMTLFGDSNFEINSNPVESGVQTLWSSSPLGWSAKRHVHTGNIAFADGSVFQINNRGLINVLAQPGTATNLIAIP